MLNVTYRFNETCIIINVISTPIYRLSSVAFLVCVNGNCLRQVIEKAISSLITKKRN